MKSRRTLPQLDLFDGAVDARRSAVASKDFDAFDPGEFAPPPRTRSKSRAGGPRTHRSSEAPAPRIASVRQTTRLVSVPYDHAHRLALEIRALVGHAVRLHVHDNRSTMVSFRREDNQLHLRVHHMFLKAGPDVVRALADYARARSARAGRVLDQYVRQNKQAIKPLNVEEARAKPLRTVGEVYDLQELYDTLNRRYFGGEVTARIGWGRGSTNRRRRSIRMGAYYHETETILIHPALDRVEVPRYFVELVVYHEMLHQAVPQQRDASGRRCIHSPEFREREQEFVDYVRARQWEQRNLQILLRPSRPRVAG